MAQVDLSLDDMRYLCEVLQPDISKGDTGALALYNTFIARMETARDSRHKWERDWWLKTFPETAAI